MAAVLKQCLAILNKLYAQFTSVNLKSFFFFFSEWKNKTLIHIEMAESSCLINLSQNIKIVKSEYLKYWEEFSHWWGQWQEDVMRNKWNGIRRKRLTIARTDPKLESRSSNWQFGLAGMQNFYQNKTNVSSQVHSSCVLDNLCWPTLCFNVRQVFRSTELHCFLLF